MKRFLSLLLTAALLMLSAGASAEDGWFARADLSEEEQNLLTVIMMDEMWGPYDFKAPDGATHLSLTLLKMENGQWVELHTETKELTTSDIATELTITAQLNKFGWWDSAVQQNKALADGRIYINPVDPPNVFGMMIWQPDPPDATIGNFEAVYLYDYDEETGPINTFDMNYYQRVFLEPEKSGPYQQKVAAALNEPVLLELYVCFFEHGGAVPNFSEFDNPAAFEAFDYSFAVTATFTAEPPQEAD